MYLKELTELSGVPGAEDSVLEFVFDKIKDKCDEIYRDSIGNLIAINRSKKENAKKVMVLSHMDEVALIITKITDEGFLKFDTLGGIDASVLVSKKVLVGKNALHGVIGAKAIHLQKKAERGKPVKLDELYIDIGANDKKEAEEKVNLGDYAVFDSEYIEFGDKLIKAKALDDRVGCDIMISLSDKRYDYDLYLVFTAQEETGLRGAQICVNRINPDFAIVLETTACSDTFGSEKKDYSTVLGKGVVLSFADMRTYYSKSILKDVARVAKKYDIPYQYKRTVSGGNDAGAVQTACGGIKTIAMSVPTRYIHSPSSVISRCDYDALKMLCEKYLEEVVL